MPSQGFLDRVYRFSYGALLLLRHRRTLELQEVLRGKRVAIVGAANSAFNTGKGDYIDQFDVVIRINKGTLLLKDDKWKADLGRKTDILFHSFFENEKSGGGPLDFDWFDSLGIKYVVNPIAAFEGYRVMHNFYKKNLSARPTYSLPFGMYRRIRFPLGRFRPTIGFCALMASLQCDFKELYLTGFTFFRTPFGTGYRNDFAGVDDVRKFISDQGLHNPDLELENFVKSGSGLNWKNIVLDPALQSIISQVDKPGK